MRCVVAISFILVLAGCSFTPSNHLDLMQKVDALEKKTSDLENEVSDLRLQLEVLPDLSKKVSILENARRKKCSVTKKKKLGKKLVDCANQYENPTFALAWGKCLQEQMNLDACK